MAETEEGTGVVGHPMSAQEPQSPRRAEPPKAKVHDDGEICMVTLESADDLTGSFGTRSREFADLVANELVQVASTSPIEEDTVNAAIATVHGLAPSDELEAMLAAQMFAAHRLAMKAASDAVHSGHPAMQDMKANQAAKLMRVFVAQVEALQRHRGKGQQRMTVEHVHVHDGGQAVVGQVSADAAGGGNGRPKCRREEQPHEP